MAEDDNKGSLYSKMDLFLHKGPTIPLLGVSAKKKEEHIFRLFSILLHEFSGEGVETIKTIAECALRSTLDFIRNEHEVQKAYHLIGTNTDTPAPKKIRTLGTKRGIKEEKD